jgi:hypothetical protein
VLSQQPAGSCWNQLHIRGFYAQIGVTPSAMTQYMQELNPECGDFRKVFARLDALRTRPRDELAEELLALSL